jgi:hypothetical protein
MKITVKSGRKFILMGDLDSCEGAAIRGGIDVRYSGEHMACRMVGNRDCRRDRDNGTDANRAGDTSNSKNRSCETVKIGREK